MMLFTFPDFNKWSSPLFFLSMQGLLFVVLLLWRWNKKGNVSDLLLGLLLLILCYHRTSYTIGFMDWYDTYRNTKVNYFLVPMTFAIGPLLYLYTKSVTSSGFRLIKKHWIHFVPLIIYFIYRVFLYGYDLVQPGFEETQNGVLMESLENRYISPFYDVISEVHQLVYLVLTIQMFIQYRSRILQFYSNTFSRELGWLRNFLGIYLLLWIYNMFEMIIDVAVVTLDWRQGWWYQFIAALAIIYIAIKGYFTDTKPLKDVEFNATPAEVTVAPVEDSNGIDLYEEAMSRVSDMMESDQLYLDPELSLKSLSRKIQMTPAQLSEVINSGFGINFNDFVNKYRVEEVKKRITSDQYAHLSLLSIALDCGFNSKATFNRVFKKLTNLSPSAYKNSLK